MVMGTIGYMAPEQVRGQAADYRADIFAFGVVLYEMLAGTRAFERATGAETMTAILREDPPPLTTIRDSVPPALERVVDHCLEKRPEDRFQSARDLAFALGASASSTSGRAAAATITHGPRRNIARAALPALGMFIVGLAGGALLYRQLTPSSPVAPTLNVRYLTYSGSDFSPSASPDGRAIAFRSDRDGRARIWVKQLATGTEAALTEGPLDDSPAFSPDGSTILFTRGAGARGTGAVQGATTRRRAAADRRRRHRRLMVSRWKRIVFLRMQPALPGNVAATYVIVAASDGTSQRVLTHVDGSALASPHWSPDGETDPLSGTRSLRFVFAEAGQRRHRNDGDRGRGNGGTSLAARWTPSGRLLSPTDRCPPARWRGRPAVSSASYLARAAPDPFLECGLAWAVCGDRRQSRRRRIAGLAAEHRRVVRCEEQTAVARTCVGSTADLFTGRTMDRLLVRSRRESRPLGEFDVDRRAASTDRRCIRRLGSAFTAQGRLLWSSNRSGNFEIWIAEADGSGARQLTHDGVDAENPSMSPDGTWLVYASTRPNEAGLWRARGDGSDARLLVPGLLGLPEIPPDGQVRALHRLLRHAHGRQRSNRTMRMVSPWSSPSCLESSVR